MFISSLTYRKFTSLYIFTTEIKSMSRILIVIISIIFKFSPLSYIIFLIFFVSSHVFKLYTLCGINKQQSSYTFIPIFSFISLFKFISSLLLITDSCTSEITNSTRETFTPLISIIFK